MNKAALVTGGARRIGRELCLALAADGYDIALHYHHSQEEAEATAAEVGTFGAQCRLFAADLSDTASYGPLVTKAKEAFPYLNLLINNASIFEPGRLQDSSPELLARNFRINFEAPFFLTQAFARSVEQGAVINMVDSCVSKEQHSHLSYLLSKKALLELTKMAAVELAPRIRVNGICPGFTLPSGGFGDEYKHKLEARLPLGQIATVSDIVGAMRALLAAPAITGQCLYVDGGEWLL